MSGDLDALCHYIGSCLAAVEARADLVTNCIACGSQLELHGASWWRWDDDNRERPQMEVHQLSAIASFCQAELDAANDGTTLQEMRETVLRERALALLLSPLDPLFLALAEEGRVRADFMKDQFQSDVGEILECMGLGLHQLLSAAETYRNGRAAHGR